MFLMTLRMILIIFMNATMVPLNATAMLATMQYIEAASKIQMQYNAPRNPSVVAQQSAKTWPAPKQPSSPPTASFSIPVTYSKGTLTASSSDKQTNILLSSYISVSDTLTIPANTTHNNNNNKTNNCKSLTGTWGDVDPNLFYLCDVQTQKPLHIRCPEGKGYFNGLNYTGCLPYDQWPACVASSSTSTSNVHICDRQHMQQPWETMNPNKFYICLQEATQPVLLNCEPGKGFVHAMVSGDYETGAAEIVGCAKWEKWRSYMKCTGYY